MHTYQKERDTHTQVDEKYIKAICWKGKSRGNAKTAMHQNKYRRKFYCRKIIIRWRKNMYLLRKVILGENATEDDAEEFIPNSVLFYWWDLQEGDILRNDWNINWDIVVRVWRQISYHMKLRFYTLRNETKTTSLKIKKPHGWKYMKRKTKYEN